MAVVEMRGLWKNYGRVEAVRGIDLDCLEGELLALLGPSGCGKTSTLRMVAGLEHITSGTIKIGGRRVNDLPPNQRDIAMVFEDYALYPTMTVYENMAFPLKIRKVDVQQIKRRVLEAAEILRLTEILERNVRKLSGGQQQRVAIGRAIVREPVVFLMDEPISHLDAALKAQLRAELKRIQQRLGTSTIYVTHDQLEAMALANRIAVMKDGLLQQVGRPEEIYRRPANEFVAGFIGEPPMNILECSLAAEGGHTFLKARDFSVVVPEEIVKHIRGSADPSQLRVGVRPEHVLVGLGEPPFGAFEGEVYFMEPRVETKVLSMRFGKETIRAETEASFSAEVGDMVWVSFNPAGLNIFDKLTRENLVVPLSRVGLGITDLPWHGSA